jgi:hypothetical protein
MACWRRQDLIRLVTTDGADSGFAAGHGPVDAIMEHLATVDTSEEANFRSSIERLTQGSIGGAFVAVVGDMARTEMDAIARLRTRYGWLRVVTFERSSWDSSAPDAGADGPPHILRVRRGRPFAPSWEATVGTMRTGTGWSPQPRTRLEGVR